MNSYIEIANSVYGFDILKFRNYLAVDARRQFSLIMISKGYSLSEIGKALDKHHTTIMWYRDTASYHSENAEHFRNNLKKSLDESYENMKGDSKMETNIQVKLKNQLIDRLREENNGYKNRMEEIKSICARMLGYSFWTAYSESAKSEIEMIEKLAKMNDN